MRRTSSSLLVSSIAFTLFATACGGRSERHVIHELTGNTMGTTFSIKLVDPPETLDKAALEQHVRRALERVESETSTYLAASELSRFNAYHGGDWFVVSAELCALVAESLSLSAASGGAFDVTVGPLVNVWGFGPDGSAVQAPEPARIATLLGAVGFEALHADCSQPALRKDIPAIYVDLSALAKGYGVDVIAALLEERGIGNYLAEIGGELRVGGSNAEGKAWAVAIESPRRNGRAVHAIARLTNVAVATSGDYRNYFESDGSFYSHTIDPRTGYPVRHTAASVTVVADRAAVADAMATALLVLGPDDGLDFAEREAIAALFLVRTDGDISERLSSRFAAEVSFQ